MNAEIYLNRILFVLPPERERITSHSAAFSHAGFEISLVMCNEVEVEHAKKLFDEVIRDWGHNLVCVIFPPFDFYTPWFRNARLPPGSGSIRDFLLYFEEAGIKIQPVEMNWEGAFDDKVNISESTVMQIIEIARICVDRRGDPPRKSSG